MYETFARVYDTFMDEVPYDEWAGFLIRELKRAGIENGLVLDLGCGTGQITKRLSEAGYDMIGVDSSSDMLQIAQERKDGRDILYLMQDMRQFELYGTVRAVVSTCDSLNYITDREDLLQVFRLVNNYLDPGGLFLFDMNSVCHYEQMCADNTFAESRDECSFIWENSYDPEERINEYDLTLFLRREDGLYERFLETHREKAWRAEEVISLLTEAGMKPLSAAKAYLTKQGQMYQEECHSAAEQSKGEVRPPRWSVFDEGADRILFSAAEHGKKREIHEIHQDAGYRK